jgi:hypothetical protein
MKSEIVTLIGLALDAAGAIIMFVRTPYHSSKPTGYGNALQEAGQYSGYGEKRDRQDKKWIRVGFGLMIVGFILQFVAAIG